MDKNVNSLNQLMANIENMISDLYRDIDSEVDVSKKPVLKLILRLLKDSRYQILVAREQLLSEGWVYKSSGPTLVIGAGAYDVPRTQEISLGQAGQ